MVNFLGVKCLACGCLITDEVSLFGFCMDCFAKSAGYEKVKEGKGDD